MKERLQKILSRAGVCSRRKAEELIKAGKVRVNGRTVTELGSEADPRKDKIEALGKVVKPEPLRYFLFNKPDNVITSVSDPAGRRTVMDYILTHPSHEVLKEYEVVVRGKYSEKLASRMEKGVKIDSGITAPCEIEVLAYDKEKNKTYVRMVLHEGKNREIRKMMEAYHYPVFGLKRVKYSFLSLDVTRGSYRRLTTAEVKKLYELHK